MVYDHIDNRQWETATGFSPDEYILTHGGKNRLSAYVKATWHCYGDTSGFQKPCAMPKAIEPLFKKGEHVQIVLEKHVTDGWRGTVELSLFRKDLNSNVYGVRFDDKRALYNRYFEMNLKKVEESAESAMEHSTDAAR